MDSAISWAGRYRDRDFFYLKFFPWWFKIFYRFYQ
jgi:hypothetical protein